MMNRCLTAALAAATFAGVAAGDILLYDAFDHPDGALSPAAYGLRMDNFGPDAGVSFSFEDGMGNSMVDIIVDTTDPMNATLRIVGTITGNSADGGTLLGSYLLDVTYSGSINGMGQFFAGGPEASIGSLTALSVTGDSPIMAGGMVDIGSMARGNGDVFLFGLDLPGSRLPGSDDRYEGFGWVDSNYSTGTEDFLFTAEFQGIVPTPGALATAGLAGLLVARRRR